MMLIQKATPKTTTSTTTTMAESRDQYYTTATPTRVSSMAYWPSLMISRRIIGHIESTLELDSRRPSRAGCCRWCCCSLYCSIRFHSTRYRLSIKTMATMMLFFNVVPLRHIARTSEYPARPHSSVPLHRIVPIVSDPTSICLSICLYLSITRFVSVRVSINNTHPETSLAERTQRPSDHEPQITRAFT